MPPARGAAPCKPASGLRCFTSDERNELSVPLCLAAIRKGEGIFEADACIVAVGEGCIKYRPGRCVRTMQQAWRLHMCGIEGLDDRRGVCQRGCYLIFR